MATPGFLKIKVFWNKSYDVIISVLDLSNKILSWHSTHIIDYIIWPKFGKSSISMIEVNFNSTQIWPEKPFLWVVVLVGAQKRGIANRYDLQQCVKSLKTESEKVFGSNSYVWRKYREKKQLWEGRLCLLLLSWMRLRFYKSKT